VNSQPNGRSADSSGPTSYFLPKFSTIQIPKTTVTNHEERLSRSVVGEFNRVQRELGKQECSNGPICPHHILLLYGITSLEEMLTEDEKLKLDGLKCKFNLVISVD